MDNPVCEPPITTSILQKFLQNSLGPNAILQSIDGKRIALGQGMASHIFRFYLNWENGNDQLRTTIILKISNVDTFMEGNSKPGQKVDDQKLLDAAKVISCFHHTECNVYNLFGLNPPIASIPRCYGASSENNNINLIVMEDLSSNASIIPSMITGLTLPQILNATTAIAKLHAWSLTTEIDWRNRIGLLKSLEACYTHLSGRTNGFIKVRDQFPDHFGSIDVEKLFRFKQFDRILEYMQMHRPYMEDVLVHGDFWANNIMFDKKSDDQVGDQVIGIIDFQSTTRGCPMADLGRLMSCSVSPDIRRNHIDHIINHYYQILKSIVGDKLTIDVDRLKNWYQHHFAFNAIGILKNLPNLSEVYPKSEGEQKKIESMIFVERMKAAYDDAMVIVDNEF